MSWLRQRSIESFRSLNPGWEVQMVNCTDGWPPGEGFRFHALRSDFARYQALYDTGGIYFDTDIVFVRPIPEKWLRSTLLACLFHDRHIAHIACLGGVRGHQFWQSVIARCRHRESTGVPLDCQAFGASLLQKIQAPSETDSIGIPSFLPCRFDEIEKLWWAGGLWRPTVPEESIGVHWYGGDRLSNDMEPLFTEESMPECMVAEAVRMTLPARMET